jgi:hypothetical protein
MKIIITEAQLKFLDEQNSPIPIFDDLIDFFLPGTPVEDGRKLLSQFDAIIKRRIDYNKKNKLPVDTLTPEEKSFRQKIFNATPPADAPYPDVSELSKIIQDINLGKPYQPTNNERNPSSGRQNTSSGDELKKMWLGIDEPGGDNKGLWVKSEYRPATSSDPKTIYYRPSNIPKLSTQQFDELFGAIMKTRQPDGKFPGGNASYVYTQNLKLVPKSFFDTIESDLGNFKFGAAEENGKKYISVYDEWDLAPPLAQQIGVDIQKYGKKPLIYYRIYR